MIEDMTSSDLIELGVSEERAHDVHQALQKLSVKIVTWAAQVELQEKRTWPGRGQTYIERRHRRGSAFGG